MVAAGRGSGWVAAQSAMIFGLLGAGSFPPHWPSGAQPVLLGAGSVLAIAGVSIAVWSARLLGRGWTMFPRPREEGHLVDTGPFRAVRHPIYSAGLVSFVGYAIATSILALALTGVLAVLWALKARREERFLQARYDGYDGYARRVRFRLIPFLY